MTTIHLAEALEKVVHEAEKKDSVIVGKMEL